MKKSVIINVIVFFILTNSFAELIVNSGNLLKNEISGTNWAISDNCIANSGPGNVLYAPCWIGAGQFAIKATVSVDKLDGGAYLTFGRSHSKIVFGDLDSQIIFKESKFLSAQSVFVEDANEIISANQPFTIEIVRDKLSLQFFINSKNIGHCYFTEDHLEDIGLCPGNTTMKIHHFEIIGDAKEYKELFYRFTDNFEKDSPKTFDLKDVNNSTPIKNWMCLNGKWSIEKDNNTQVLRKQGMEANAYTLIHGFGKNSTFETRFKINNFQSNSGLWFTVRHNLDPTYMVRFGYDFANNSWVVEEFFGEKKLQIDGSKKFDIEKDRWYTARLEAWGEALVLYIDGKKIYNTNSLMNRNYGRAGFYADNIDVSFDDVSYRSESKVQPGVWSHIFRAPTISVAKFDNGKLSAKVERGWTYNSTDNGYTWKRAQTNTPGMNNILLKNHDFLSLKRHIFEDTLHVRYAAHISEDNGQTWSQPHWLNDTPDFRIAMTGKTTETSSGRIFFICSSVLNDIKTSIKAEKVGGVEIWYSDDHGNSWTMAQRLSFDNTGVNIQEAVIFELSNGTLKLFGRTPYGYLYQTESTDNGQTWDTNFTSTGIISTMCAFNTFKDLCSNSVYLFWVYDDPTEHPMAQKPRERVCLAVSYDDAKTWKFLTVVDDFEGHLYRFMNLGLFVDKEYVYTYQWIHGSGINTNINRLTRFDKNYLKPEKEFPTLH